MCTYFQSKSRPGEQKGDEWRKLRAQSPFSTEVSEETKLIIRKGERRIYHNGVFIIEQFPLVNEQCLARQERHVRGWLNDFCVLKNLAHRLL